MSSLHHRASCRGAALGIVIMTALVCSIAAYFILIVSLSQARIGAALERRTQARHLAEAGLVIAMQKLKAEATTPYPPGCVGGNIGSTMTTPEFVDTNNIGGAAAPDPAVQITVTNCGPARSHRLSARAVF